MAATSSVVRLWMPPSIRGLQLVSLRRPLPAGQPPAARRALHRLLTGVAPPAVPASPETAAAGTSAFSPPCHCVLFCLGLLFDVLVKQPFPARASQSGYSAKPINSAIFPTEEEVGYLPRNVYDRTSRSLLCCRLARLRGAV